MSELFIGGPADGRRQAVPADATRFYVRHDPDKDAELYHRERIAGIAQDYYIWRWDGISTDEVLAKLLEGYPAPITGSKGFSDLFDRAHSAALEAIGGADEVDDDGMRAALKAAFAVIRDPGYEWRTNTPFVEDQTDSFTAVLDYILSDA